MKVEFNNLYTHFIFSCIQREPFITEKNRTRLEKYITGIVNNNNCRMYAIYANPDHIHFLISRSPEMSEQTIAEIIANSSTKFIIDNNLFNKNFKWQNSCSAFSVSKADINRVCKYILNQKEHHRKHTFTEEYSEFIKYYQNSLKKEIGN